MAGLVATLATKRSQVSMRRKSLLLGLILHAIFVPRSFVFAQRPKALADTAYRNGVLQKIADLLESKYVLSDKAKGYADP